MNNKIKFLSAIALSACINLYPVNAYALEYCTTLFLLKRFQFEINVVGLAPPFYDFESQRFFGPTLPIVRSPVSPVSICIDLLEPVNEVTGSELDDVFLTQDQSLMAQPTHIPTPTVQIDQEDHTFTAGHKARLEYELCSSCVVNIYENGDLLVQYGTQSYQNRDLSEGPTEYRVQECFSWSGGISCGSISEPTIIRSVQSDLMSVLNIGDDSLILKNQQCPPDLSMVRMHASNGDDYCAEIDETDNSGSRFVIYTGAQDHNLANAVYANSDPETATETRQKLLELAVINTDPVGRLVIYREWDEVLRVNKNAKKARFFLAAARVNDGVAFAIIAGALSGSDTPRVLEQLITLSTWVIVYGQKSIYPTSRIW